MKKRNKKKKVKKVDIKKVLKISAGGVLLIIAFTVIMGVLILLKITFDKRAGKLTEIEKIEGVR